MTQAPSIVILTGAGISAESGIDTFRDKGGLWEQHPIEQVATPEGFAKDPALVHQFYNLRRAALKDVEPNAAHIALARLQSGLSLKGGKLTLITQNVDDLHERGGVKTVIHMHGILTSMRCQFCKAFWPWTEAASPELSCPHCYVKSGPRPDIVWFGEMPYYLDQIDDAMTKADLFVSIGTSGAVYPAAGLVGEANRRGIETLELNLEPSQGSALFDESRLGKAGDIVPIWVDEILASI
ncbi:NAD-dependent deacetylase [Litorimonas taeanensis]|uniref:NAD-dependent protein deacylase n=1 Tax=Litorimonas taeanensis TaxID=568099 RepID=A0A420WE44_9PROT|nr:NAD-dependent deacylase [Litorimonas taeanensis]RKQ69294.1 NAD-dependent deacetylase [Litorimonas taeanensis]